MYRITFMKKIPRVRQAGDKSRQWRILNERSPDLVIIEDIDGLSPTSHGVKRATDKVSSLTAYYKPFSDELRPQLTHLNGLSL